jgi:hypothetical protein
VEILLKNSEHVHKAVNEDTVHDCIFSTNNVRLDEQHDSCRLAKVLNNFHKIRYRKANREAEARASQSACLTGRLMRANQYLMKRELRCHQWLKAVHGLNS